MAQRISTPVLLLLGARVLTADGSGWLAGHAVLLRAGRIERIAPLPELAEAAADAQRIDCTGLYLLPGLIDLHTHLLLHPYDEAPWDDQVLKESLELRTIRAVNSARATLQAGFTTIRDLGTEGAAFADVALRDAVAGGMIDGPRIVATTRAIVATGCYGPAGFDPRWALPQAAQEADGVEGIRRAVREQIAAGADWIKVYADYRRQPDAAATPTFSLDELRAAVDEANSAGLRVCAHATTDQAIRRCVDAGVATIEHGYEASEQVLTLMRQRGVVLCPTLAAAEAMARYTGWDGGVPEPPRIATARELMRRAGRAGVTVACGSDAGVFDHGDNARELELMVAYGMKPAEVLRAATAGAAQVLGAVGHGLGRVAPEHTADLVAVVADPLADIAALRGVALVVREGRVVLDRRAFAARDTVLALCHAMLAAYSQRRFDEVAAMFAPGANAVMDLHADGRRVVISAASMIESARTRLAQVTQFREWLDGEAIVLGDRNLAVVWAPYRIETDGRRAHGIDVFQWIQLEEGWKLASIGFTNVPE